MDPSNVHTLIPLHETKLTVRTYECDLYGHVNNAVYLNYLEYARMEYLASLGFSLEKLRESGYLVVVVNININYKLPAFPGDELSLRLFLKEMKNTSGIFLQTIWKKSEDKLICDAEVTWVFTDRSGHPVRIPELFRNKFPSQ